MTALWTSAETEAATLGHATQPFIATGLSIDTRSLNPGDLFVALKGDSRDGHAFVSDAIAARASAALVTHRPSGIGPDAPLLTVANTLRGLEDLAREARARSHAKIIAVTGSAGKTTTKEILRFAFGALGKTHASHASHNNHWGVPLSLAALPRDAQFGIFEIGMNHFGEIRALVGLVRPHVALVTTVAAAHLEFFGSCEAIADAKSEIFEGLADDGIALVPADNSYADRLTARARQAHASRVLRFGESEGCDARLLGYAEEENGAQIEADILGRPVNFHIGAPGKHIALNALAALLSIAVLEGDVLNAAAALRDFSALKGRGARGTISVAGGEAQLIDESYNANPASMAAALSLLASSNPKERGRRIAVLGDMLEMGGDASSHHASLIAAIEDSRADLVFLCGPNMRALWDELPQSRRGAYAPTSRELAADVARALHVGDVVLVKGSFGSRMALVLDALVLDALEGG